MSLELIGHLMRGGAYGHYWFKQSRKTQWWPIDSPPTLGIQNEDSYFGVHPSRVSKNTSERTISEDIAAINCLYADIDSKHFGGSKTKTAEHIKRLQPMPSAIVDSGGGYHCYWLLKDPFTIESLLMREIAQSAQARWVYYVGGDPAVHDLARILRLPGTLNYKYTPARQITVAYLKLSQTYEFDKLIELLPPDSDTHSGDDEDLEVPGTTSPNRLTLKEIVELAQKSRDGEKFKSLWRGFSEGYESTSEADLAFCCILAFWTGGDYEKMDALFRASQRMRDKWNREDYRHQTLTTALGQVSEHYIDPGGYLTAGANDEGNAQCVYARHKNAFSYCEALGWLHYQGRYWDREVAEASVERVIVRVLKERRVTAIKTGPEVDEKAREAVIKSSRPSAANVRNCKAMLKSLITVPVSSFDTSADMLNCPNGVLDLRTGKMYPHDYRRKFTYCISVPYNPNADPSFWVGWLTNAVGGHKEVVDFMQLALGYSLTGQTREETMFYVFGPARAGKGTFTETFITLLGGRPLATEVGMEMFVEKRRVTDQGFDLASLKSTRFVAASESAESHWLDATKLKRWTGGNWITCAHKYGQPFSYRPQFKIWLSSNYELQMDADDTAGWARVQVINFPNSHLGQEDKTLKDYMKSPEVLEGILSWAVKGAIEWYQLPKGGLKAPALVREQTAQARSNLDWVGQWIKEEVEVTGNEDDKVPNASLYARYADWCQEQGVPCKKLPSLTRTLRRAGYKAGELFRDGERVTRGWVGARLRGESLREQLHRMSFDEDDAGDGDI